MQNGIWFNLSTGTVGAENGGTGRIEYVGKGWYRCIAKFSSVIDDSSPFFFGMAVSNGSTAAPGNGSTMYAWGAQVEQESFPTPYIPTNGSQVTR